MLRCKYWLKGWNVSPFFVALIKAHHFLCRLVVTGEDVLLPAHSVCRNSASFSVAQGEFAQKLH